MPKYRKKPVVIEAFQITLEARWNNADWPNWLNLAWNKPNEAEGAVYPSRDHPNNPDQDSPDVLQIQTLEGVHNVSLGDFIIKGIRGELFPCKSEIFHATYELVPD